MQRFVTIGAVPVFVCSAFTSIASLILILFFPDLAAELGWGLWARAGFFGLMSLCALGVLVMWSNVFDVEDTMSARIDGKVWVVLTIILMLQIGVHGFHIRDYPEVAPDESHHLIVAKNLAMHGRYASGNPEAGFKNFDSFDSVGPAVLAPVSISFKVFGVGLAQGRLVIALFALGLSLALFQLMRISWGTRAGLFAAFLVPCAFGSIYLSRTLYGEVPALFYFCCGLLLWRGSLRYGWCCAYGVLAGVLLGLAILSKAILLLSAFAFLGAVAYDWAGPRRIKIVHCVYPAVGVVLMLGFWAGIQQFAANDATVQSEETLSLYQHYLLFGVEPVYRTLLKLLFSGWPWGNLMLVVGYCWIATKVFRKHYDPALIVLWLTGIFFFFWWLCFTPGQIPRYLYFSQVIGLIFLPPLCTHLLRHYFVASKRMRDTFIMGMILAALFGPTYDWTKIQLHEVTTNREMAPVHEVSAYSDTFPEDVKIGVDHYPLEGALSFLVDRYPKRVEALSADELKNCDVLIYRNGTVAPPGFGLTRTFAVYSVFERSMTPE